LIWTQAAGGCPHPAASRSRADHALHWQEGRPQAAAKRGLRLRRPSGKMGDMAARSARGAY